jgi:hypothetical protein
MSLIYSASLALIPCLHVFADGGLKTVLFVLFRKAELSREGNTDRKFVECRSPYSSLNNTEIVFLNF